MSIAILSLELQLEKNHNSGVYTYVFWVNDSNKKKHTGTLADLNKIQDGHRRNVLCYCIADINMVRKHSFVYLNMYMLLPYQPVIKFES